MKDDDKEEEKNNNDNKIDNDENIDEFLDIGNLNINQEADIIENPKKHLVNTKKLNFLKSNTFNIDSMDDSPRKNKKTKRITYEDIYLGNDMFIAPPKSYPRDYEKNNLLLSFSNSISKKSSSNMNLINLGESKFDNKRNKHISNVLEEDDDEDEDFGILRSNTFEYFCQKGEIAHLKDFLTSLNSHRKHTYEDIIKQEDSKFVDEEEKKNKNIFYIENETELNNLNYYNKKNKCNILFKLKSFYKKIMYREF